MESVVAPWPTPIFKVPPFFGSEACAVVNMLLAAARLTPEASASWVNSRRVMRPFTACLSAVSSLFWMSFMSSLLSLSRVCRHMNGGSVHDGRRRCVMRRGP